MKKKTFSNGLVVKHRRSAIFFENEAGKSEQESEFTYAFTPEEQRVFVEYLQQAANESWENAQPKEAYSIGSDYWDYYDRRYDNNGYLSIIDAGIAISAPHLSKDTLYQFNKAKIQSFLYDLERKFNLIT
ncbi:hypothetical protein [Metabacillus sp. SLBN-84]